LWGNAKATVHGLNPNFRFIPTHCIGDLSANEQDDFSDKPGISDMRSIYGT
jgi:hypothetical protein